MYVTHTPDIILYRLKFTFVRIIDTLLSKHQKKRVYIYGSGLHVDINYPGYSVQNALQYCTQTLHKQMNTENYISVFISSELCDNEYLHNHYTQETHMLQ